MSITTMYVVTLIIVVCAVRIGRAARRANDWIDALLDDYAE